jgi:hypothetical protein
MITHRFWSLLISLLFALAASGTLYAYGARLAHKTADGTMPVQTGFLEGVRSWALSGHAQLHHRLEEAVSALKSADPWIAALFLAALSLSFMRRAQGMARRSSRPMCSQTDERRGAVCFCLF